MSLRADQQYNGHIENAGLCYSNSGTLGLQIHLECEEGKITHTLWITEKTSTRVKETLLKIGVAEKDLQNEHALENIGDILAGREVSFTTTAEEYKGEKRVKVQWLNKPRADTGSSPARLAASMFGGKPVAAIAASNGKPAQTRPANNKSEEAGEWGITDDDIPF